jgi:hypothetical protein
VPPEERDDVLRDDVLLPDADFLRPVERLVPDFLRPPVERLLVLRVLVFREVVFRELVFRELVFLRAVARPPLAPALRACVLLRVPVLRDEVLRADVFLDDEPLFERELVLRLELFLLELFLRELELRVDERELEREPERDEDRVVAGTARAMSSSVSPMVESPHVSSASPNESLNEPAVDGSSVSPVPLQSSWVINDLLSRIARARFPTTFVCNVQRGRTSSFARC